MRVPDHFVRLVELPRRVYGVTMPNDDGTFSVYINSLLSSAEQRRTLEHELAHMARDHFYSSDPVGEQESEARGETPPPEPEPEPVQKPAEAKDAPLTMPSYFESLDALTEYLRSVGALGHSIESLGAEPLWE